VTAADTPIPYSEPLEDFVLPGTDDVVDAARRLLAY
jgi:pyruvate/2-oxoglutarate/acetoin dehydrogenase E1 component